MANTFKSFTKASVSTSTVDIYTVAGGTTSVLIGLIVTNRLGSGTPVYADVLLEKADVSADDIYLVRNVKLYDGITYTLSDTGKIILETGDKIRATSNTLNSVDIMISVLEQT